MSRRRALHSSILQPVTQPDTGRRPGRLPAVAAALALALAGAGAACAAPPAASVSGDDAEKPPPSLVGPTSREQVEAAEPGWVTAEVEAAPDGETVAELAEVEPGAEVTVYFGTWCSDSRRELARLWRGFDEAGIGAPDELPFDLDYVAVDRDKHEPGGRTAGIDLRYVPTFVVRRGGREVGRIVESAPHGVEHDLLALLTGEAAGVVSGRDDLGGDAEFDGADGAAAGADRPSP